MSKCKIEGCNKYSTYGYEADNKYLRCSDHKEYGMINIKTKNRTTKCLCGKNPSYGYKGQRPNFCAVCKDPNDCNIINVYEKICAICDKIGHYTHLGSNVFYCIEHKEITMINYKKKHLLLREPNICVCGAKFNEKKYKINERDEQYSCYLCHLKNKPKKGYCHCGKRATFGITEATRCKEHIEADMKDLKNINKKNKKISAEGEPLCGICINPFTPSINPKSKKNELYKTCENCRNIALNHRCEHGIQPSRCKECKGVSFCIHGKIKIACVECDGSQICQHKKQRYMCKDCGGAAYCEHGIKKSICIDCNGSQLCEHKKHKRYCLKCEGTAFCIHKIRKIYCRECGGTSICQHDINRSCCIQCMGSQICIHKIKKSRCRECDGKDLCKGQENTCTQLGNKNYNGYCTFCFSNLFPDDPLTLNIRKKSKELKIRDFINENYADFIHDKPIIINNSCDCTNRRRIDFRKIIGNTMLAIEVDEFQHKRYDPKDEEARYNDMMMVFSGKWHYIRYNPDTYRDGNNNIQNPDVYTRLAHLKKTIDKAINTIINEKNKELITIEYIYYDENLN